MKREKLRPDVNEIAFRVLQEATGAVIPSQGPNPEAVKRGRAGGKKGGPARKAKLSKAKLSKIGRKGAAARWSHPPKP